MELPRPDFWHMCSRLLQTIEIELAEIGRTEGWSVRAQTLSRRQANLRHTIADLTRHRLAAFVNHAALSNLASTPFGDAAPNDSTNVVPIDWQRHDGAERAFHAGVAELINQYKQNISWDVLQKGVLSSNEAVVMTPAGNSQLDDFVDEPGGLTGNEPPLVEPENEGVWEDPEIDEEDRIAMAEEFPEIEEHVPVSPEINTTTEEVSTEESSDEPEAEAKTETEDAPETEEVEEIAITEEAPETEEELPVTGGMHLYMITIAALLLPLGDAALTVNKLTLANKNR